MVSETRNPEKMEYASFPSMEKPTPAAQNNADSPRAADEANDSACIRMVCPRVIRRKLIGLLKTRSSTFVRKEKKLLLNARKKIYVKRTAAVTRTRITRPSSSEEKTRYTPPTRRQMKALESARNMLT